MIKTLLCLISIAAMAAGCASVGTPIAKQNVAGIKKGVTTETELVRMFGNPTDKSINSAGKVVMTWVHSAAQPKGTSFIPFAGSFVGGTNVQVEKLQVVLGKDGRVEDYVMNESHRDIKMGGD
jgi:hypothetical protein